MKKLIKGSKAAKDFMAKIRAKRKVAGVKESKALKKELAAKNIRLPHGYITTKKLSGLANMGYKGKKITQTRNGYYEFYSNIKRKYLKFNNLPAAKQMIDNEIISKTIKTKLAAKKLKLPHGYEAVKRSRKVSGLHKDTNSHNVNLRIVSGVNLLPSYSDEIAAREISLFADNDSDLYRQSRKPILINLSKKYKKGTFKTDLAAKLWVYYIENAMKKYHKIYGGKGSWSTLLKPSDRKLLAMEYAIDTLREFELGNFTEK